MHTQHLFKQSLFGISLMLTLVACQSANSFNGLDIHNDLGSQPVNKQEAIEYKRAVIKCYKNGGSRVVKIEGQLRCY
jgi:hypothetical protein